LAAGAQGGQIVWPASVAASCVIDNVFATGACIEVFGQALDTFELVFDVDEARPPCHVVWRTKRKLD
jgi:hypothetical protein